MEHKHNVVDTDPHFVIDEQSRTIKYTGDVLPQIVQHDHNSERFTIQLPRVIDGHDMTLCNEVRVNYINIDSSTKETSKGPYPVTDLTVTEDGESAVCSWLVSGNATKFGGKLSFMLCFMCKDDEGNITYRWNTLINTELTVGTGMENGTEVVEDFPDILAQWQAELFGIGDTEEQRLLTVSEAQQAAIAAKGEEVLTEAGKQKEAITARGEAVLATIPAEYSALSSLADQNHRNKAGAIVQNAEGESIVVNDASEYPLMGLKVFGRSEQLKTNGYQLFDASRVNSRTANGATITNNGNGSFTISGSGNMTGSIGAEYVIEHDELSELFKAGALYLSVEAITHPLVYVNLYKDSTFVKTILSSGKGKLTSFELVQEYIDDESYSMRLGFSGATDVAIVPGTVKPMLYQDGDGTWEPYTGGVASPSPEYPQEINSVENALVTVCGKNLLKNIAANSTSNGITFTVNEDGSVTVDGTATAGAWLNVSGPLTLPKGTYILSGCPKGGAYASTYVLSATPTADYGNSKTFTLEEETDIVVNIGVYTGCTVNNLTFYPMIRLASIEDNTYEPYKEPQTVTIGHTLPGIPVSSGGNYTDTNGQQWICDEVDLARGVYVHRVEAITLDENTEIVSVGNVVDDTVYITTKNNQRYIAKERMYCDRLPYKNNIYGNAVEGIRVEGTASAWGIRFRLNVSRLNSFDVSDVLDFLKNNPLKVIAPLVEPIETALTDAEITAFKAMHSNYPCTTVLNDAGAHMAVEYVTDTKLYIDNKFAQLQSLIN